MSTFRIAGLPDHILKMCTNIAQEWGLGHMEVTDDDALTHLDGRSGAVVDEDLITSPNMTYIPMPLFGHRDVRLRADLLYGADDYLRWPQPYIDIYPHYSCILRPQNEDSEWSIAWKHPNDIGLEPAQMLRKDLFVVSAASVQRFNDLACKVQGDLRALTQRSADAEVKLPASVQGYEATIIHTVAHLQNIGFEQTTILLLIRETQRVLLETDGFVRYWSTYVPHFTSTWPSKGRPELANQEIMGAFTYIPDVALKFACARIPVWLIRDMKEVPLPTTRIVKWGMPQPPSVTLNLMDCTPRFRSVWQGTAAHHGKYINMHHYTVTHLIFRYPWGENLEVYNNPEFDPILRASPRTGIVACPTRSSMVMFSHQTSGPTPTTASQSKKKKSKVSGFGLMPDPEGSSAPREAWRKAFATASVDLDLPTRLSADLRRFFFPPFSMFNGSMCADKHALNWIYLRSAWTGRLLSTFEPCGLTALEWREVLGMNTHTPQGTSHSHVWRQQGAELLRRLFECEDLNEMGDTLNFHYMNILTLKPLQPLVRAMAAWEANESNTRIDMARFLAHGTSIDNVLAHSGLLTHIFDRGKREWWVIWTPWILDFDWKATGLCSSDYVQWKTAIVAMIQSVCTCPGGATSIPTELTTIVGLEFHAALELVQTEEELDHLEDVIVLHYLSTMPDEATWKSEDPAVDWQEFKSEWLKEALKQSPTLEGRHPGICKLKAKWTTKVLQKFKCTSVTKSQAGKALDNVIKDARKTLQIKVEEGSAVDVNKIHHRTLSVGILDRLGKTVYSVKHRSAIEARCQELQASDPSKYKNAGAAHQAALSQLWKELSDIERATYEKEAEEKADVDVNIAQFVAEIQTAFEPYTKSLIMGPGGGELMLFYGFRNSKNTLKTGIITSHCSSNFGHPVEINTSADSTDDTGAMDMHVFNKDLFEQVKLCWAEMTDKVIPEHELNERIDVVVEVNTDGLPVLVYDANDDELTARKLKEQVADYLITLWRKCWADGGEVCGDEIPWDELCKRPANFYDSQKITWVNTQYLRDLMKLPEGTSIWDVAKHFARFSGPTSECPFIFHKGDCLRCALHAKPILTVAQPVSPPDASQKEMSASSVMLPTSSTPALLPAAQPAVATVAVSSDSIADESMPPSPSHLPMSPIATSQAPPPKPPSVLATVPSAPVPSPTSSIIQVPDVPPQPQTCDLPQPETPGDDVSSSNSVSATAPSVPVPSPTSSVVHVPDAPPQPQTCDLPRPETLGDDVSSSKTPADDDVAIMPTCDLPRHRQLAEARAMAEAQARELCEAAAASLVQTDKGAVHEERSAVAASLVPTDEGAVHKEHSSPDPAKPRRRGRPRKMTAQTDVVPVVHRAASLVPTDEGAVHKEHSSPDPAKPRQRGRPRKMTAQTDVLPVVDSGKPLTRAVKRARDIQEGGSKSKRARRH
ncbi:hypothetical protein FISHEDRAFT_61447 [Fistulina hepatica ATCC 64428]|uniref:Uncharacterized protein n=1 Tax=Fistulina hepatica ATCC 64428 TaxID=1128425 RepID=A0A0D7A5D2_9AGAR|nr:hypothetical protein FISHEDRAFT_61447 [Fistulina hepatica ATCC 64428]